MRFLDYDGDFFEPTDLDFMSQPVETYAPPPPAVAAPAPAEPAGQWQRIQSGGEGWEDVFVPATAPVAAPAPAPLSLPSGWSTNFSDSVTLRGDEVPEVTPGAAYSFGVGDEELLRRLGFSGPVSYETRSGFGDNIETQQYLTPEAQKFIEQGNYRLAGKETPMGYYKTAFDPSGKALVDPVFTKTNYDDALTNAVFTALSVAAGNVMGPGMALVNAARAADSGDVLGALASAAGGVGGLGGTVPQGVADVAKTAGQALNVARAIEQKDPLGLLASGTALTGTTNIGDVPVKDILNYGKIAQAVANQDVIGALGALGNVNKDFRVPEAIADPLNIASGLYQASQGSGAGLINAIRGIGKESAIGLSREEADFQDLLESLAPTSTPLPKTEDLTDYGVPPAPVVASAPAQTDTYTEDFESAIPEPPEEVAPAPEFVYTPAPILSPVSIEEILSQGMEQPTLEEILGIVAEPDIFEVAAPVITPEPAPVPAPEPVPAPAPEPFYDYTYEAPAPEPAPEPPAYNPPEQTYTQEQAIEELLREYSEPESYAPAPETAPEPQQVEITGAREPVQSPISVEDILSQGVEQPTFTTLEEILAPAPEPAPEPQQVEIVGSREEPVYTPAPIPSPVSVEDILREGIEQPTFTTLEDIIPALQRVEVTGAREPEAVAPEAPRTFTATEGQVPSIEIVGTRAAEPSSITSPISVEDILREGIEAPPPLTIEDILGTAPVPAPAPAPPPAPAPAPAPSPAPKSSGPDLSALFALLGMMGGQKAKPEEYRVADVRRGVESGLGAIEGMYGSQDDLMRILRG